jgi:hypothetical protein
MAQNKSMTKEIKSAFESVKEKYTTVLTALKQQVEAKYR